MSEAQEISAGQEADAQVKKEMGIYNDPTLQAYVSGIGMRLAMVSERPTLPWHYTVVDSPVVNAFALPGGYIYVTRGILPFLNDEAQLAGVLGHETGHVTARHAAQQYACGRRDDRTRRARHLRPGARPFGQIAEQGLGVLFLKFSREFELQADQLGASAQRAANWDPAGVPDMLATLGRLDEASGQTKGIPNWLETHPEPLARIKEIQPQVQQLSAGRTDFVRNQDAMLRAVDGLIYGDNPDQGIVRGTAFIHPPLRFRIDFPSAWDIQNSPRRSSRRRQAPTSTCCSSRWRSRRATASRTSRARAMQDAGFRIQSGSRQQINGLDAYVGVYQGQLQDLGNVTMRVRAHPAPGEHLHGRRPLRADAVRAVRQRVPREHPDVQAADRRRSRGRASQPHRPHVVRPGDSWQSIAERSGGVIKPATLAVMNGAEPSSQPTVGKRIKIVAGG